MLISNRAAADIFIEHDANSCTDITGFGLAGHLAEMLADGNASARLELNSLPVMDGALDCLNQQIFSSLHLDNRRIKEAMEIGGIEGTEGSDPLLALLFDPQTAGGLLASVPTHNAEACLLNLQQQGYADARIIGQILDKSTSSAAIHVVSR